VLVEEKLKETCERLMTGEIGLLVIQTAFLGDVVLLTALLRAVKKVFPKAELFALVIPSCAEVVEGWVDHILTIDKHHPDVKSNWRKLTAQVKYLNIGAALLPHRSARSGLFARDADIPIRIGFDRGGGTPFHTHHAAYLPWLYEGKRNLELLRLLTDVDDNGLPELRVPDGARAGVSKLHIEFGLKESEYAVMAPASVWMTKRWPVEHFRKLCEMLMSDYGLRVVVVGGSRDRELCAQVLTEPELNFAGRMNALEAATLMQGARLVVTGDTAPAHLATASGARQVIIFGSTAPRFGFLPPTPRARALGLDIWCRPCTDHGRERCPRSRRAPCLWQITPEAVISTAGDWLSGYAIKT
jgi:heptosyltransferase II